MTAALVALVTVLGWGIVHPLVVHGAEPVHVITGRVVQEPATPNGAAQPFAGTVVTLVPRSQAFRDRLEAIKRHARDSLASYTGAVAAIRRERQAYERELNNVDARPLQSAGVDANGHFVFHAVPEGEWLLMAWHSRFVKGPGEGQITKKDRTRFTLTPRAPGFQQVTIWLMDVTLGSGPGEPIELTDRNGWFSGVLEESASTAGH